jgi:superfamily II DNA or RNA helicase
VASKHKSAQWFLKQGFFAGIKSFKEFEARTGKLADTVEMGDALEILVEAYLHLDKVLNAKDVWVVGSIPLNIRKALNLPNDSKGIDGVYEDAAGNYIPYQVKYRTNMVTLPFGEISEFLGITEKSLQDRLIFTNARKLSIDVANRTGVRSVRADKFNELTEADFKRIHAWLTDKKVEPFKPWDPLPHQREAIEKITAGLKAADRTTAVMACGTGKTLVALWAAEAQQPKTVLVLVPSLALLSQTLPDWCKQTSWGERFRYLCVCSDASVDREAQQDGYTYKQEDLEFSVTTEPKRVKSFLAGNKDGVNVIFSTYQSAEVVADGLKGQTVDLGIFDEAHKTTGDKEGLFAFGLSDKNIRIRKRLFLTATPRHYKLNKRDKDGDFQVVSMNDEAVYGKVSYCLPFSAAVAAGIIVPYKVIISVSLNKEVDAELLRRGSTRVRRDEIQAKWVANQIALKRAIEKTGASKIITFHSRVNLAEEFACDSARGFQEHVKGFDVFHVNGGQNAADRKALLENFKASPRGLITNARCLTEGVDVPAVDMVAFVDPRKSKIDIAQAAGRAMRQSKATNKKVGYIVVPLFIEQKKGETEAAAFTRSGFDEVAEVLAAMLDSDDDLVDTIKELQEARGRGDKFNPRQLHEKIEVIGPAINLDKLTQSIDVEILEHLAVSWDKWFGLLQVFKEHEGHCRVKKTLEVNGLKLGSWVNEQRHNKDRLSPDRIKRLNSIGFSWDPLTEQWEAALNALIEFRKREGHCRVSQKAFFNGIALGSWATTQRIYKEQLNPDRIRRLDALGFSWDPRADQWEEAFSALQIFRKREGHCRVAGKTVVKGVQLGTWVVVQRQNKSRLTSERINRLNTLGFSWDPFDEQWERAFLALLSFKRIKGHCLVPRSCVHEGIKLGTWAFVQRQTKKRLTPDRIKRLDSIGFSWDPINDQWLKFFNLIKKFHTRNGHCNVERSFVLDGARLGTWAFTQRQNRDKRSAEQIKLLNSLGFVWDPLVEQWEESFRALQKFKAREGHCLVVRKFKEGKHKLGVWVGAQRQRKRRLSPERIQRLDSLGFSWDPLTDQWEEAFKALKKFHSQEGHCRVSRSYAVGTIQLGNWVMTQRKKRSQLSADQIKRLESIDFNWDPRDEQWEYAFCVLQRYHKRTGHTRVEADFKVDGFKLGNWVVTQRTRKEILPAERVRRLNSLGFSWDPRSDQWEEGFSALQQFHKLHGHCRVSKDVTEISARLCNWITTQRTYKKKLTPSQLKRLESIGFSWDPRSEKWEEAFELLVKFHKREGHSTVPFGFLVDGFNLGSWVSHLRKIKATLTTDRINRLESLDFSWDPRADQWEEGFVALQRFQKRQGHCRVVQSHVDAGFKLGKWVNAQRVRRSELAPIRIKRLDSIGFIWKA